MIKEMGMVEFMKNLSPMSAILGDTTLGLTKLYKITTQTYIHSDSFLYGCDEEADVEFVM